MDTVPATIPAAIAKLLVACFCHTITESQKDQVDEWICETNGNMRVLEECLERSLLPVLPDQEREQEFEPWKTDNLN